MHKNLIEYLNQFDHAVDMQTATVSLITCDVTIVHLLLENENRDHFDILEIAHYHN